MGVYYDRLTNVAQLNYADDAVDTSGFAETSQAIASAQGFLAESAAASGLMGKTGEAVKAWIADRVAILAQDSDTVDQLSQAHAAARQAMGDAKDVTWASRANRLVI